MFYSMFYWINKENTVQNKQNKCDYIWISSQNGPIIANAIIAAYYIYLALKSLKIPKGSSESVNRRTDNTMVKRKRTKEPETTEAFVWIVHFNFMFYWHHFISPDLCFCLSSVGLSFFLQIIFLMVDLIRKLILRTLNWESGSHKSQV